LYPTKDTPAWEVFKPICRYVQVLKEEDEAGWVAEEVALSVV
jgi:hypothetical protein